MYSRKGLSTTVAVAVVIIIIVISGAAYYVYTLSTPSSSYTTPTTSASSLPGKGMAIGINFDVGGLGDRGFNDLAYQGVLQANKTLGVNYYYTIAETTSDFVPNFETLISHHVNLVVGVGFDQDQAIAQEAAKYPNQMFAQVDGDDYNVSNIVAIKYQENVGSAIVAAMSVAMSKTNTIGFIGGMSTGIIYKFWNGWKYGAQWADQYVSKVTGHPVNTTLLEAYTGPTPAAFDEPTIDQSIAQGMISKGADIVFTAAGGSGLGGLNAVGLYDQSQGWNWSKTTAPPVLAIGVDADQDYYGTYQYFALHQNSTSFTGFTAPSFVLTSEIKKVDTGVFNVMKAVVYGNVTNFWNNPQAWAPSFFNGQTLLCGNDGASPCHVRNVYLLGWSQGAVGPTDFKYTSQYLTPLATQVLRNIEQGIVNGTITIPENYNYSPP